MSPEREAEIRHKLDGSRCNDIDWDSADDLLTHIDHMRTWPGLMETIRSHFPEDVFDGSSGDPGPLLLVALRELDAAKAALDAERKAHAETRRKLDVAMHRIVAREDERDHEQSRADEEKARADALEARLAALLSAAYGFEKIARNVYDGPQRAALRRLLPQYQPADMASEKGGAK